MRQRAHLAGRAVAIGQRLGDGVLDLAHPGRVEAGPADARLRRAGDAHAQPRHRARGERGVVEHGRQVADAALERVHTVPHRKIGGRRQLQLDDAGLGQDVGIGAGGELSIGRRGPVVGVAREAAVGRDAGHLEGQQRRRLRRSAGGDLHADVVERRHHAQRQRAAADQVARRLERVGGARVDVAGARQQRDPQRAVRRVLVQVDALDDAAVQRDGLVQLDVGGEVGLVARIEQPVVVEQLRTRRRQRALEDDARLQRQHLDAHLRAERHRAGAQLEVLGHQLRLHRAAVVGDRDQSLRRRGRRQRHAQHLQELDAVALGHQVRAVQQVLGQEREQLHQRDAGIALVEVGPLGRVRLRPAEGVLHQLREAAIVDGGRRERHGGSRQAAPSATDTPMRSRASVATRR